MGMTIQEEHQMAKIMGTGKDPVLDLPIVLIKEKVIYPGRGKRKGKTQKDIGEIVGMEIDYHLKENTEYEFDKVVGAKDNADLSKTIALGFKLKVVNAQTK